MFNFNFISAPAGANKTGSAIQLAQKKNLAGLNVLIIVPTTALCDEIVKRSNGKIQTIHSKDGSADSPASRILELFRKQGEQNATPTSLVITEASFHLMSYRHAPENWVIIKDEAMEPLSIHSIRCPDSKQDVMSWFELLEIPTKNSISHLFKAVRITNKCPKTTTIDDDVYGRIHELKHYLSDSNIEVLVDFGQLEYEKPTLTYSVFVKPELFADFAECWFMAANFEHTFLYQQWKSLGVEWTNRTPSYMPKYVPSERVRIHYYSEFGAWSARRRGTTLQDYIQWFKSIEPNKDYVYVANNDEFVDLDGERIPAVCHGLNKWREYKKFMSCASYLINNSLEVFYQYYGSSTTDARGLRNTQMLYQQLMRTDLRNYTSDNMVDVYVPTLTEARELLLYLPDATICDLNKNRDGDITNITGVLNKNWIPNIIEEEQEIPEVKYSFGENSNTYLNILLSPTDIQEVFLAENKGTNKTILPPSISAIYSVGRPKKKSDNQLINFIKHCDKQSVIGKTEQEIIDIKKSKTGFFITGVLPKDSRFLADNILGNSDVIAFDFDDTKITTRQLSFIFKNIEYLTYTTISDNPKSEFRRFRMVIPTSRAMTKSEHTRIMNYYKDIIEQIPDNGLDIKCLKPERKFYLPHQESEINHIYKDKELLDVDGLLARIVKQPIVQTPTIEDLVITYPATHNPAATNNTVISKIYNILNSMSPGDRSHKAVQIGGILGKSNLNWNEKLTIIQDLKTKGVDESAIKQAKIYAKL